jgi:DNA-binding LytR/AlgR family response regulator
MSNIKCIIIEDEPLAVKVLTEYVQQVPFLELLASFKDAILATEFLRNNKVDLIFLDIHLPKLKGISFLKTLNYPISVIMTTAYHQYAVDGFNLNVTDYLLKPFEFDRFLAAVNKVRANLSGNVKSEEGTAPRDFIFIQVQKKKVKILFSSIIYIESQREYVKIVTSDGEFVSKMSTHEIESLLPQSSFIRVHRSFIVSIRWIESYTADEIRIANISLPVGKGYRNVLERL